MSKVRKTPHNNHWLVKHHGQAKKCCCIKVKDNTTSNSIATTYAHSSKSMRNKATIIIAGTSIAGVLALTFIVLLVLCLLKSRRFQRLQAEQKTCPHHVTNNTIYDNLVVTSQRHDDYHTYTTLSYDKQAHQW